MDGLETIKKCPRCGALTRNGKVIDAETIRVFLMNTTNWHSYALEDIHEQQLEKQRARDRAAAALIP